MRHVWTATRVRNESGEELAAIPLEVASDVKALKTQLQRQCRLPRFRMRLYHQGILMKNDARLSASMDIRLKLQPFVCASVPQQRDLLEACKKDLVSKAEEILQRPVNPDKIPPGDMKFRLLHYAAANGRLSMVRLLVEAGAAVQLQPEDPTTPLLLSAEQGHLDTVRFLIEEAGADVNELDPHGWNALQAAYVNRHLKVSWFLLEAGSEMTKDTSELVCVYAFLIGPILMACLCAMLVLAVFSMFLSFLLFIDYTTACLMAPLFPLGLLSGFRWVLHMQLGSRKSFSFPSSGWS